MLSYGPTSSLHSGLWRRLALHPSRDKQIACSPFWWWLCFFGVFFPRRIARCFRPWAASPVTSGICRKLWKRPQTPQFPFLSPETCWRLTRRRVNVNKVVAGDSIAHIVSTCGAQIVINRINCQRLQGRGWCSLFCPAAKCQCLLPPPTHTLPLCYLYVCALVCVCSPCLHFTVIRMSH